MTTTREPAVAPAPVLTPDRLARLGAALADAVAYRQPDVDDCPDCSWDGTHEDERTEDLCADHQADLDKARGYTRLRDELGIEEQ